MRYELVIFDLDGTLLDTTEGIVEAVSHTIDKNHLPELSEDRLLEFIGPPVQESFKDKYGVDAERAQQLADDFRQYYKDETLLLARPYDGIYDTLDGLVEKGIKVAVATYKREDYAVKLLKHYGFDRYSDMLYGADNENKLTKGDIIQKCITSSMVSGLDKVLMVGDSVHDLKGARAIGVDFVGVTYGFGFKEPHEISGDGVIGSCKESIELLGLVED